MKMPEAMQEMDWLLSLGRIELKTGFEVTTQNAPELLKTYDAVFLGLGLGADAKLGIPGEDGTGVHGAVALIERIKSDPTFALHARRALVVGGGNTALDIAHELALLNVDVAMVYRRGEDEMSGYLHELKGAQADTVQLLTHRRPVAIERDAKGHVSGLRVVDASLPDSPESVLPADLIVVAIGQSRATQVALAFPGVQLDARGRVQVDAATHRTGNAKVWSAGDCVNGGKEVVNAVAEAKIAARSMHAFLAGA
jgi:glutamate synthase (NADPH/NADH) small chain